MKIKQVCEATGLTDRAVRYYIEEGLLTPAFTENYLGRRAYDFSDADVAALNHIATLRKFGFTVEELRRILTNPAESVAILAEVRARKEETVRQESDNLAALTRLDEGRAYTVAELAVALNEPVKTAEVPKEDRWLTWKERLIVWLKATPIWVGLLLPVLLLAAMVVTAVLDFRFLHVKVYWRGILLTLTPTLVLGAVLVLGQFRRVRYGAKLALAVLALVWFLPLGMICGAFSMDFYSETTDVAHYRQVDDQFFFWFEEADRLFPAQARADGRYYYYSDYDGNQALYAEWQLSPEELTAEIDRARNILSASDDYVEMQHGGYTCLIVKGWVMPDFEPFLLADRNSSHSLTMFAWNEETGTVRYILSDHYLADGEIPFYMTLPWA